MYEILSRLDENLKIIKNLEGTIIGEIIQNGKTIEDPDRLKMPSEEFYLKNQDEMVKLFSDIPQALENTVKIAERCNVEIDFTKT